MGMKKYIPILAAASAALILLLIFTLHFWKNNSDDKETAKYESDVYTSSMVLNNQAIDVKVVVDENRIKSISLNNLDETMAAMYPLIQPALDNISRQIYEKQSLEGITYEETNMYTSAVLMKAIQEALSRAQAADE